MAEPKMIFLDGKDWRMNYFRPEVTPEHNGTAISNLWLADGERSGADQEDYDDSAWWSGTVPGDVKTILMENGELDDPFYGRNSDKCRWTEDFEWWFRKRFTVPAEWKNKKVMLRFRGVDLFATYWINGRRLGDSSDMFVPVSFDVTDRLDWRKDNVLAVRLAPPPKSTSDHYRKGHIPDRAHFHKSQVSWGWDWTREIMTAGIWDSVELYAYAKVRIDDVFIQAVPSPDCRKADVDVEIALSNVASAGNYTVKVDIKDEKGVPVIADSGKVFLRVGRRKLRYKYSIKNPALWWPNGYGSQPLYCGTVAFCRNSRLCHQQEVSFGVRRIEMLRNPGSAPDAYPLTFCVNGRKIFARGGNWVPPDMLFGRIREDLYGNLIQRAQEIGFNMFRVWGGGLVEKDSFYSLCDRYGILVWQEFPLSCANYPKDRKFVEEKGIEAEAVIKKLRNHPSIALYCGGNELFYYGESSRSPVLRMFKQKVGSLHPMIDYHFSSPDKEREGERDHGPWHAQKNNHRFWNRHFRNFASEVGCNAMPSRKTVDKVIPPGESFPAGPSFRHHFMPDEYYYLNYKRKLFRTVSLDEDIFFSQFLQADTLRYLFGQYRIKAWKSSGCLIWQYNSAWPEGAWSVIDYYGVPKMSYYWLKEVCRPLCIHVCDGDWELKGRKALDIRIFLVNNSEREIGNSFLEIEISSESGSLPLLVRESTPVKVDAVSYPTYLTYSLSALPGDLALMKISWKEGNKVIAVTNRWYARKRWLDISEGAKEFLFRNCRQHS